MQSVMGREAKLQHWQGAELLTMDRLGCQAQASVSAMDATSLHKHRNPRLSPGRSIMPRVVAYEREVEWQAEIVPDC